jgi:rsbT co-antagonist protein RsbR
MKPMQNEHLHDERVVDVVAEILVALSNVVSGDYEQRLDLSKLPSDSALATLCAGVNEMIDSLQLEHDRVTKYEAELEEKIAMIDAQRAAIDELSTPIIEVWDGVVCLPVVGVVDTTRAAAMTELLLGSIVQTKARYAIIDITAIQVMDTGSADHFLRMARSVRLLGSQCLLSGVSPSIALTLVHMGVELKDIRTFRTMRNALASVGGSTSNGDGMRVRRRRS